MSAKQKQKYFCSAPGHEARVSVHDQFHLEFKGIYETPDEGKYWVRSDAFFFIPRQLDFDHHSFKSANLFTDSKHYARLEPLPLSLKDLADNQVEGPLATLIEQGQALEKQASIDEDSICFESKLYAATFSSAARKEMGQEGDDQCNAFCQSLMDAISVFHEVISPFMNLENNVRIRKTAMVTRSYMSFEAEVLLGKVASNCDSSLPIKKFLKNERKLRAKYHEDWSLLFGEESNKLNREHVWSDYSFFKKVVTSCLRVHESESKLTWSLSEMMMGFAAAVAMAFALAVAVISAWKYPMNSMPWLVIATIGYIFKDRIKEYLRGIGVDFIQSFVPDRTIHLNSADKKIRIGEVTDKLSFPKEKKLDAYVREMRDGAAKSASLLMPDSEVVMRISKQFTLKKHVPLESHGVKRNVATIMRFDVRRILARMDDPMRHVALIDLDTLASEDTKIPNVYQVPLIMRYRSFVDNELHVRYLGLRVILDRNGIKRIEDLDAGKQQWAQITEWDDD